MFNKSENKTQLLLKLSNFLESNNIENFKEESQIMISYACKEENFINVQSKKIDKDILESIVNQRLTGKPLSKIIKQKGFWNHIFITDENTLDPRADSEIIIENILKDLSISNLKDYLFVDLCCGTGCLGISILHELKNAHCDFIDISKKAISVCQENILNIEVKNRSITYVSDLFSNYPLDRLKDVKFIICNPPYIPSNHYFKLNKETLYDPKIALDGGEHGTSFYFKVINFLIKIKFKGDIYFEIDPIINEKLQKFLLEKRVKIVYKKPDYLNLDRLIKVTLP